MNIVAIDIETTDLDPRVGEILTMCSYPHIDGPEDSLVFHNSFFDVYFLAAYGHTNNKPTYDTMVMHHLIEEDVRREKGGLKELTQIYLDRDINPFKGVKNKQKAIIEMSKDERHKYCLEDARATYDLFFIFKKKMEENGTWKLYEDIVRPFCRALLDAKVRGIRVDVDYFKTLKDEYEQKIKDITAKLDRLCSNECYDVMAKQLQIDKEKHLAKLKTERGKSNAAKNYQFPGQYNWDSNRLVGNLLFGSLKLPFGRRTQKAGRKRVDGTIEYDYIVDEEILSTLAERSNVAKYILERRALCKLKRTYIEGILELAHDGYIHPNLVPLTVTGRCKASEPNIQNIPREGPINRGLIPRDGYKIIKADYAQLELRVAAGLSEDEKLCEVFHQGKDPHSETAKSLGIDRVRAKTINFAMLYGAGPWNLAIQLGHKNLEAMPPYKRNRILKETRNYIDRFFSTYSGLKQFLDDAKEVAIREGEIRNIFGRIRHLEYTGEMEGDKYSSRAFAQQREAANFVIQATAHDIVSRAIVRTIGAIKEYNVFFLAEQHDALIFECSTTNLDEAKQIIQQNLQEDFAEVPLICEVKVLNSFDEGDIYEQPK